LIVTAGAAALRVGAAAEIITPPPGAPLAGYYHVRAAEGVDDDLYCKAIVLERDGVKAALVVCDLLTMPRRITEVARERIAETVGIPAEHVMISATHTHTGPHVMRDSSQDPAEPHAAEHARNYADALPAKIAAAVKAADERLAPARASAALGRAEGLAFNRRFFMTDGSVAWNPGKHNPNIVKPAGPTDPDVPVVVFESLAAPGRPLALHVSFAMHLDTIGGSSRISADYPAPLAAALAKAKGADLVTVFAAGACGDINHIDVNSAAKQGGLEEPRRIGNALAAEVLRAWDERAPVADGPLRAKRTTVELPIPELMPGEFEAARDVVLKTRNREKTGFMDRVKAFKVLDVAARKGKPIEAEVQVVALGDELAWVAVPGELFVELGLDIKRRSPFKHTIVVELANTSIGYIPTKRAYAEGAYEPTNARCAAGAGEIVADAAVRLLGEMRADR
jgi:hypothetical protein